MKEPKVTEKKFCEVMALVLKDKKTKSIYNKTFERKDSECQLKK
jgi:hypothetical protein